MGWSELESTLADALKESTRGLRLAKMGFLSFFELLVLSYFPFRILTWWNKVPSKDRQYLHCILLWSSYTRQYR